MRKFDWSCINLLFLKAHAPNHSQDTIGKYLGCSGSLVWLKMKELGIPMRRNQPFTCIFRVMLLAHWGYQKRFGTWGMNKRLLAKMLGHDLKTLRSRAKDLNIPKREIRWTQEMKAFIKEKINLYNNQEMIAELNEKFPRPWGEWNVESLVTRCHMWGIKRDDDVRSGMAGASLKKAWDSGKRKREGPNKKAIGETTILYRTGKPPTQFIKTETGWRPHQLVMWEQHYGLVAVNKYVGFKDGNTLNVTIDNLELKTKGGGPGVAAGQLLTDGYLMGQLFPNMSPTDRRAAAATLKAESPEIIEMLKLAIQLHRRTNPYYGKYRKLGKRSQNDDGSLL